MFLFLYNLKKRSGQGPWPIGHWVRALGGSSGRPIGRRREQRGATGRGVCGGRRAATGGEVGATAWGAGATVMARGVRPRPWRRRRGRKTRGGAWGGRGEDEALVIPVARASGDPGWALGRGRLQLGSSSFPLLLVFF